MSLWRRLLDRDGEPEPGPEPRPEATDREELSRELVDQKREEREAELEAKREIMRALERSELVDQFVRVKANVASLEREVRELRRLANRPTAAMFDDAMGTHRFRGREERG